MYEIKNLPHNTTINRHSAYSRYNTALPANYQSGFAWACLGAVCPVPVIAKLSIVSANLQNFPRSDIAEKWLECFLKMQAPEVYLLQEVRDLSILSRVIAKVNMCCPTVHYVILHTNFSPSALNLVYLVNTLRIFDYTFMNIFGSGLLPEFKGLRSPVLLDLMYKGKHFDLVNVHAPARSNSVYNASRYVFLSKLSDALDAFDINQDAIIAGDWNWQKSNFPITTYLPDFSLFFCPDDLNNDFGVVAKNLRSSGDFIDFNQMRLDDLSYCNLTTAKFHQYVSDHFPVRCEFTFLT